MPGPCREVPGDAGRRYATPTPENYLCITNLREGVGKSKISVSLSDGDVQGQLHNGRRRETPGEKRETPGGRNPERPGSPGDAGSLAYANSLPFRSLPSGPDKPFLTTRSKRRATITP
jgi:hypothetical protein